MDKALKAKIPLFLLKILFLSTFYKVQWELRKHVKKVGRLSWIQFKCFDHWSWIRLDCGTVLYLLICGHHY